MQGIEQALQQAVQQPAAMQVQQAQTEQQLREAREAAATATAAGKGVRAGKGGVAGGASGGGPSGFGIDTRMLGRPDTFDGSESKWGDWSTVMKAYAALCNASLVSAMPASEVEAQEKRNSDLRDQLDVEASVALYYMLVLLTRNEPLNIVVNSGAGEGLLAWRRLGPEVRQCCSNSIGWSSSESHELVVLQVTFRVGWNSLIVNCSDTKQERVNLCH